MGEERTVGAQAWYERWIIQKNFRPIWYRAIGMSRTTDTRRDKTRARPPAIVRVNRKRTNEVAEVAPRRGRTPNFTAKYCARIRRVVRRFTDRTPDLLSSTNGKSFSRLPKIPRLLLLLVANSPWKSAFFLLFPPPFFLFSSRSFSSNTPAFYYVPLPEWTFINESLLRSTSSFFRRYRHDKRRNPTRIDRINSAGRFQFNAKRGARARDLVKFKDMPRNGWITQYCRR